MNIETASENVRTMGEAMKAAAVPVKHTEGCVEAEVLSEGSSGAAEVFPGKINAPEDMDAEAIDHP